MIMFGLGHGRRLERAYKEGREAVLLGLYAGLRMVLPGKAGSDYSSDELADAAANLVNRLTLRPESRPDPRDEQSLLGDASRHASSLRAIQEAAALILLLDCNLAAPGRDEEVTVRRALAHELGGSPTSLIEEMIDPRSATPKKVRRITFDIAERLSWVPIPPLP